MLQEHTSILNYWTFIENKPIRGRSALLFLTVREGKADIGHRLDWVDSRNWTAGSCLRLLFYLFSLKAYAVAGETSRAMRLALLISATRRS
jgi:hypothetical protein